MHTYIVAFEIKGAEEDACGLTTQLSSFFEAYWQVLPDVWIVQTPKAGAADVFRILSPHLYGADDRLLIVEIGKNSAHTGFTGEIAGFLKDVL